ncbi:MAG: BRCT domain-containing protein [Candidatus Hodarchaeales archaeon]
MIEIKDKSFCITGAIEKIDPETGKPYPRNKVEAMISDAGGITKKSVVRSLDYLVVGRRKSPKIQDITQGRKYIKAKSQSNTLIIDEDELFEALGLE